MKIRVIHSMMLAAAVLAGCNTAIAPQTATDGLTGATRAAQQYQGTQQQLSAAKKNEPVYYPTPKPYQDCCKVTGGGFILVKQYDYYGAKGDLRINFGFNAQFGPDGKPKGNVNVVAHVDGPGNLHFKSDEIKDVACMLDPYAEHPRLTGVVTVKGTLKDGNTFKLVVRDAGEPGVDDTFKFTTSTGFSAEGTLEGGNIQLHKDDCK